MGARSFRLRVVLAAASLVLLAACGSGGPRAVAGDSTSATVLRLGYFPNVTHAPAIVGVESGLFAERLGAATQLETQSFAVGTAAVEALFAGAVDATFVGPSPTINAYVKSRGQALRIVAGATSGGAALVVRQGITRAAQLNGATIASPGRGNTQDIALRRWLADQGLKTTLDGDGDVTILPQENAQTLETFRSGDIDGAWVPEPWSTRLVTEGGGSVLVDERSLWPGGRFVATHLVVRTEYLTKYPATVTALIEAELAAIALIESDQVRAQRLTIDGIARITGKRLAAALVDRAWGNLVFTSDPIAASLVTAAKDAQQVGLLPKDADLEGIYDLTILNQARRATGQDEVVAP